MGEAKRRALYKARDAAEYEKAFARSFRMLAKACQNFDAGDSDQAYHLSSLIANFCNDGKAPSLISKSGFKKKIAFTVPNERIHLATINTSMTLVSIKVGNERGYAPKLDLNSNEREELNFKQWWKQPVVRKTYTGEKKPNFSDGDELSRFIVDNMLEYGHSRSRDGLMKKMAHPIKEIGDDGRTTYYEPVWGIELSREALVLAMRNTEASHIGREVHKAVEWFDDPVNSPWKWTDENGSPISNMNSVYSATIRQIAHELVRALEAIQPDLASQIEYPQSEK